MDFYIQVTVGVPVYNVEKYVEKAILSVLEQDFRYPYELLVVDDCGMDKSMDIVRSIAASHSRGSIIRIIRHDHNLGLGAVRNTIINNAEGRFLFFLDSDDWMTPDALSTLYGKATETGADLTIGSIMCSYSNESTGVYKVYQDKTLLKKHAGLELLTVNGVRIHGEMWGKLWSADFLSKSGIICVHRIIEDAVPDFVSNVESSSICLVSKPVYYYRYERESSVLTSSLREGTDEMVSTLASIINTIRTLVVNKDKNIPGIYDLYFRRVRNCYRMMLAKSVSEEQRSYFNTQVRGCISMVPSIWKLRTWSDRMMYMICRKDDTVEQFSKYDQTVSKVSAIVSFINKRFRHKQ